MGIGAIENGIHLSWDKSPATASSAAAFAGRVIGSDTAYISHGEIQTGLSIDAHQWAPDLGTLYARDFTDFGEGRDLLVARDADGAIVGVAIVAWEATARRQFAILEDMVVDPSRRSMGIGGALVDEIERRVRERGIDWLFLESGVRNERAHAFFERSGFEMVSHVFARKFS